MRGGIFSKLRRSVDSLSLVVLDFEVGARDLEGNCDELAYIRLASHLFFSTSAQYPGESITPRDGGAQPPPPPPSSAPYRTTLPPYNPIKRPNGDDATRIVEISKSPRPPPPFTLAISKRYSGARSSSSSSSSLLTTTYIISRGINSSVKFVPKE